MPAFPFGRRLFPALPLLAAALALAPARAGEPGHELLPEAERAIDRILAHLLTQQNPDGSFRGQETVANTALALMAFMVQGEFPDHGPYGAALARAVDWLIRRSQAGNGYMAVIDHGMYEHALATLALSEAWGMSQREDLRDRLIQAVEVLCKAQDHRSGGWRYKPWPGDHDLSVAAIVMIALFSARESGVSVPEETIARGLEYVRGRQHEPSGGYGYQNPDGPGLGRTGAGTLVRMLSGEKGAGVEAGLSFMRAQDPNKFQNTDYHFYAHYYCTLAMYQSGDADYLDWYPKIRDTLLRRQHGNGGFGALHETGYAALILGIPYRYIPIYQRTEFEEGPPGHAEPDAAP